jgi:hypothetical protein
VIAAGYLGHRIRPATIMAPPAVALASHMRRRSAGTEHARPTLIARPIETCRTTGHCLLAGRDLTDAGHPGRGGLAWLVVVTTRQ